MPLNEYLKDFAKRMSFFGKWITDDQPPPVLWLPGFYFPHGTNSVILVLSLIQIPYLRYSSLLIPHIHSFFFIKAF